MRIACPTCGAAYDVPPERMPPGRTVKCARCAASWTPTETAEAPAAILPTPTLPAPSVPGTNLIERMGTAMSAPVIPDPAPPVPQGEPAFDDVPDPAPVPPAASLTAVVPARRDFRLLAAWIMTVVVLAGLAWAAVSRRAEIMRAWPPSQRAYAAIGLGTHDDPPKPAATP